MFLIELKLALKLISKRLPTNLLSIVGLALSFATIILISIFVHYELSCDGWIDHADRVYRVTEVWTKPDGTVSKSPVSVPALGAAIIDQIPGVEACTRAFGEDSYRFKYNNEEIRVPEVFMTDSSFFRVFGLDFIYGDANQPFSSSSEFVITESFAEKVFGPGNPVGKLVDTGADSLVKIIGVVEDLPDNSHLKKAVLFWSHGDWAGDNWTVPLANTYLLLAENSSSADVEATVNELVKSHFEERAYKIEGDFYVELEPVRRIHLYGSSKKLEFLVFLNCSKINPTPGIINVRIFTGIGLLILIIACLNNLGMSSAKATERFRLLGTLRTLGASTASLNRIFLIEATIITLSALCFSVLVMRLIFPYFEQISNRCFEINIRQFMFPIGGATLVALVLGIISGTAPAVWLRRIQPALLQRGVTTGSGKTGLRMLLTLTTVSISTILILCGLMIYQQLDYIKTKPKGLNDQNLMVIELLTRGESVRDKQDRLIERIRALPDVESVTGSIFVPGISSGIRKFTIPGTDQEQNVKSLMVSHDFLRFMELNLVAGRDFDSTLGTDFKESIIINQTALKAFNLSDSVGQVLKRHLKEKVIERRIIGVVADFHLTSLHSEIPPVAISLNPLKDGWFNIMVRLTPGFKARTIDLIREEYEQDDPDGSFEYVFLDDHLNEFYKADLSALTLTIWLSLLAILIAGLGLVAHALRIGQERTREFAIRKTYGASGLQILWLMAGRLMLIVLLANLLAVPAGLYFRDQWLANFFYKSTLTPHIFLWTFTISLTITLISITIPTLRTVFLNPVATLKHE